jgi:hypothetical protein
MVLNNSLEKGPGRLMMSVRQKTSFCLKHNSKGAFVMQKSSKKRVFAILSCMLILGSMLVFLAACGGSSTPASPGGGQNKQPGYYLPGAFHHEIQTWWYR